MCKDWKETFIKVVPDIFNFLINDYGYKQVSNDEWEYKYESPKLKVEIINDYPAYGISIKDKNSTHPPIGLTWIIRYLKPELHFSALHLANAKEIPLELKRQAEILLKYASNILKGEFQEWDKLREFVDKKIEANDL